MTKAFPFQNKTGEKERAGGANAQAARNDTVITASARNLPDYQGQVGLFTIVALILLCWGWSWLKSFSLLHPPQRFTVEFHDIAGLTNNAPVNVNGVRVGTVENINLKGKGQVLVHLKIRTEDVTIPKGSAFTIQTLGLVGAKYVEITLPEAKPGVAEQPLGEQEIIQGEDPVRVELYINKLATQIGDFDMSGLQDKMKHDLDRIAAASESVSSAAKKYGDIAPELSQVAKNTNKIAAKTDTAVDSANKFFGQGTRSFNHVSDLADDWRSTSHHVNKILDNPAFSSDLKETANQARLTAEKIQQAMQTLNKITGDKETRGDLISMLNKLNGTAENISHSISIVQKVADDQGLRADLKQILAKTNEALDKVDNVVSEPTFGADLKQTLTKVHAAAVHVDEAAQEINASFASKHWILHGLFGGKNKLKDSTK